jgi:probable selenium-dependent hydroxylase accessory protein YqeC
MCEMLRSLCHALTLEGGGVVSIVGAGGKTTLLFRIAHELADEGHSVLITTTTKMMRPTSDQCPAVLVSPDPKAILREAGEAIRSRHDLFAAARQTGDEGKLAGFDPTAVDAFWASRLFQWILVEADGAARRPLKAPASHEPVIPSASRWVIGLVGLDGVGRTLEGSHVFRPERYSQVTGLPLGATVTEESVVRTLVDPDGIMRGSPLNAARLVFLNKADLPGCGDAGRRIADLLKSETGGGVRRVVTGSALLDPPVRWTCELQS